MGYDVIPTSYPARQHDAVHLRESRIARAEPSTHLLASLHAILHQVNAKPSDPCNAMGDQAQAQELSQELEPWSHKCLYNWLASMARHGLPKPEEDTDDYKEITSKETEVTFDEQWTSLPSLDGMFFEGNKSKYLKLVGYGTNKVIAVDSNHDPEANLVKIQAFCLDLDQLEKGWTKIGQEPAIAKEVGEFATPQAAVVNHQLFVLHPQWQEDDNLTGWGGDEDEYYEYKPLCRYAVVHSLPLDDKQQKREWSISYSGFLVFIPVEFQRAAVVVQGTKLHFVGNNPGLRGAVSYDTQSKKWSCWDGSAVRERALMKTNLPSIQMPSAPILIRPDCLGEDSSCAAVNLSTREEMCMAYIPFMDDDLIQEDDHEFIPYRENRFSRQCHMGGFVSGSSLYIYHRLLGRDHHSLIRHDFSTKSCQFEDDCIWYKPISKVVFPRPLHPIAQERMLQVGPWWIASCDIGRPQDEDREQCLDSEVQAVRIHQPKLVPQRGKSNFVHLGLRYFNQCADGRRGGSLPDGGIPRAITYKRPRHYITFLLALNPTMAEETNEDNKLPLQMAVENPHVGGHMTRTILKAYPKGLKTIFPTMSRGLIPHILASLQFPDRRPKEVVELEAPDHMYSILKLYPESLAGLYRKGSATKRKATSLDQA